MANEIGITATLRYSKNKATASQNISFLADQTGNKFEAGMQTVGTVEEQLQKGDIGTIGYLAIRNNDTTNFVQVGSEAGHYAVKLLAGKGALLYIGASAVYLKADTAAVDCDYLAIEV